MGSVVATGPASPALRAVASGPATAEQGARVTLSALSSLGQITSYAWTAPANVELRGANTATPSFTVPTLEPPSSTKEPRVQPHGDEPCGLGDAKVSVRVVAVSTPQAAITPVGTVSRAPR